MRIGQACSWCHEVVDVAGGPALCPNCGHRADLGRLDCDCPACAGKAAGGEAARRRGSTARAGTGAAAGRASDCCVTPSPPAFVGGLSRHHAGPTVELVRIKCGERAAISLDLSDGDTFFCPECEDSFAVAEVERAVNDWRRMLARVKLCPAREARPTAFAEEA